MKLIIFLFLATINFSSDGSSNRPTITITAGRSGNSPLNSPNGLNKNSFTYNIPIQHVHNSNQQQLLQSVPSLSLLNNNFVLTAQDNNAESNNSYSIPVNLQLTGDKNNNNNPINNNNRNNFNINLTGNLVKQSTDNSSHPSSPTYQIRNTTNRNKIEDEVDLLKDLLMKNLHANGGENNNNDTNYYGVCVRCNENVIGIENGLRAMEQIFHVRCFSCYTCGLPLQGLHFYAMDDTAYCENCYYVYIFYL
jgi:hypothetical protein